MPPARIALWVASIGGLALLVRSLVFHPVPLWVAVAALLAYASFATVGVLFPQLEMYGDVLWRGEPGARRVALTFDDGPHPKTTRQVLELLKKTGQKATFFVMGRKVRLYPDVVREIHEAGHWLGLHGYEHDRLFALKPPRYVRADIERTQQAIFEACGARPVLFRPPIGHVSSRTSAAANQAGVLLVGWSARGLDGVPGADPGRVAERIERRLRDGAIVLLHDAAEREDYVPASIEALPRVLEAIQRRGLATVSIEELLAPESKP